MVKLTKLLFSIFLALLVFTSCENEMEKYYERPSNLAPPISEQLKTLGRFNSYLKLLEKTEYKGLLDKTGYSTVFAPNDMAFEAFLAEKGYTSLEQIDSVTAKAIIAYSIIFNAYSEANLVDYQGDHFKDSMSFKRKTMFNKDFFKSPITGSDSVFLDCNVFYTSGGSNYLDNKNNYKYIPFFNSRFFTKANLPNSVYSYFYPNTEFSSFNVVDAKVVMKDIVAENGYIHEVDKVILPLPNIDECLVQNEDYSLFKSLINRFVLYPFNSTQTIRYINLHPSESNKRVYIKTYALTFPPNNENFLNGNSGNDAQGNGFTLFAPKNDVLSQFISDKLAYFYGGDINNVPTDIVRDFINVHMFPTTITPNDFNGETDFNLEEPRFDPNSDVVKKAVASNGLFYGTSKIQESDLFMTVWGDIRLNPEYSVMLAGLNNMGAELMKTNLTNKNQLLTVILLSNTLLQKNGYNYNPSDPEGKPWYTPRTGGGTDKWTTIPDAFKNLLSIHIINNSKLTSISSETIIPTYGGEAIRIKNDSVMAAGNEDINNSFKLYPAPHSNPTNGICYVTGATDTLILKSSVKGIGLHIQKYFGTSLFFTYLNNSTIYDKVTGKIAGLKDDVFYTILVPNDTAITAAVKAGLLPVLTNPTLFADQLLVRRFLLYHIIDSKIVLADGRRENNDGFLTPLKINSDITIIRTKSTIGNLTFTDMFNNEVNWVPEKSNKLSTKAVIHQISNYLKYKVN